MRRFAFGDRRCVRSGLALVLVPMVLLLSSCMRFESAVEIKSKDDITVSIDLAMQTATLQMSGMSTSPESFCAEFNSGAGSNVEMTPYADDVYTGCRMRIAGGLGDQTISSTGFTLQLVDGIWTFRTAPSDVGATSGMPAGIAPSMFDSFRVDVTFPGEVLTHNGSSTLSGRTVTWTNPNDLFAAQGLYATGKDRAQVLAALGWVLAGLVALALVAAVVLVARRRSRGTAAAPPIAQYQPPYPGAMPQQYLSGAPLGQMPYYGPGPTPAAPYPAGPLGLYPYSPQAQGPYSPGQPQLPYPPVAGARGDADSTPRLDAPDAPEPTLPLPDEPPSGWVLPGPPASPRPTPRT